MCCSVQPANGAVALVVNSQHKASLAGVGHAVLTILWQTCKLLGTLLVLLQSRCHAFQLHHWRQHHFQTACMASKGRPFPAMVAAEMQQGCRVMNGHPWITWVQQQFGNWESYMACIQHPEYVGIVCCVIVTFLLTCFVCHSNWMLMARVLMLATSEAATSRTAWQWHLIGLSCNYNAVWPLERPKTYLGIT